MYTVTSPLPHRELLNPSLIAYSVMQIGLIVIYMYVLHFFSMLESWNFNFIPSNGLSKSIIIMRFIFAGQYNSYIKSDKEEEKPVMEEIIKKKPNSF